MAISGIEGVFGDDSGGVRLCLVAESIFVASERALEVPSRRSNE